MRPFFVHTQGGDLIAFHQIVSLEVEMSGALDQLRHEVHATAVTGAKYVVQTFGGPDSRDHADQLVAELLRQGEVQTFNPGLRGDPSPRR